MTTPDQRLPRGAPSADHYGVRQRNLSLVLRRLRTGGPRSRARLADDTGLNKATISSLVAELVERGLVREGAAERGGVGRPGQAVELDGRQVYGVGAEIGVESLSVMARTLGGDVAVADRLALAAHRIDQSHLLDRLGTLARQCVTEVAVRGGVIAGMTVAVPGLVEADTGVVSIAPNLGWGSVPVSDELADRLGHPDFAVRIDNEANLGALAELSSLDPSVPPVLLLLTGEIGVGGGIVVNGRLFRGGQGFAGEVGHMPLAPDTLLCGCGRRGCWETVIGLKALLRGAADPDDLVRDPSVEREERLAEIVRRAEVGDERTLRALEDIGSWLGLGAAVLVNVLNPSVLALGGYFSVVGKWLLDPVTRVLTERTIAQGSGGCLVHVSTLGFDAATHGAAQDALEAVFDDPTVIPRQGGGG